MVYEQETLDLDFDATEDSASSYAESAVESPEESTIVAEDSVDDSDVVENDDTSSDVNSNIGKNKKRQYSDLEKAQYSFKKQFARQRTKYEQELARTKDEFRQQIAEEIDKVKNPAKYAPKSRADFEYDDDYVKYLTQESVNAALQAKMAEFARQQEEAQYQYQNDLEYKNIISDSVKKLYPTPESQVEWRKKVGEGINAGLGAMIDSDPDLSEYIILSPIGPKIIYELATNKKAVQDIFTIGSTPNGRARLRSATDRMRKIEELADRLSNNNNRTKSNRIPTGRPVGKPGLNKFVKKDIFSDPKALLEMMY